MLFRPPDLPKKGERNSSQADLLLGVVVIPFKAGHTTTPLGLSIGTVRSIDTPPTILVHCDTPRHTYFWGEFIF